MRAQTPTTLADEPGCGPPARYAIAAAPARTSEVAAPSGPSWMVNTSAAWLASVLGAYITAPHLPGCFVAAAWPPLGTTAPTSPRHVPPLEHRSDTARHPKAG
ncbi:hypothetical protein GCM10010346_56900 [Streptomyces chryseus]|uniref:Uncharacterized protein n=1 Tax=Streptomyces chryseus TaxID=68186 RepID=A0ABQ3E5R3_9ACTN|nr:hypothetical protein GCM10010346_56900 [Streptomyces chryseus]